MARGTGRFGNAKVNGNVIAITSWTAKGTKELADSTDSSDYDPTTAQLWKSQQPGAVGIDVTLEGNFNVATTKANLISLLKTDPPAEVQLYLDQTNLYFDGNGDLSDVEVKVTVPGATMLTFTATFKSNGAPKSF